MLLEGSQKLLKWTSQTCPSRVKDLVEVLHCSCHLLEDRWSQLAEARKADCDGQASEVLVRPSMSHCSESLRAS